MQPSVLVMIIAVNKVGFSVLEAHFKLISYILVLICKRICICIIW